MVDVPVRFIYVPMAELPDPAYIMIQRPLLHGDDPCAGFLSGAEIARAGNYAVPVRPDLFGRDSWSVTTTGDVVRVPLHRLRTPTRAQAELVQAGFLFASKAVAAFTQLRCGEPQRLIVILGNDVIDHVEPEPFYEIALGMAVVYK